MQANKKCYKQFHSFFAKRVKLFNFPMNYGAFDLNNKSNKSGSKASSPHGTSCNFRDDLELLY